MSVSNALSHMRQRAYRGFSTRTLGWMSWSAGRGAPAIAARSLTSRRCLFFSAGVASASALHDAARTNGNAPLGSRGVGGGTSEAWSSWPRADARAASAYALGPARRERSRCRPGASGVPVCACEALPASGVEGILRMGALGASSRDGLQLGVRGASDGADGESLMSVRNASISITQLSTRIRLKRLLDPWRSTPSPRSFTSIEFEEVSASSSARVASLSQELFTSSERMSVGSDRRILFSVPSRSPSASVRGNEPKLGKDGNEALQSLSRKSPRPTTDFTGVAEESPRSELERREWDARCGIKGGNGDESCVVSLLVPQASASMRSG